MFYYYFKSVYLCFKSELQLSQNIDILFFVFQNLFYFTNLCKNNKLLYFKGFFIYKIVFKNL